MPKRQDISHLPEEEQLKIKERRRKERERMREIRGSKLTNPDKMREFRRENIKKAHAKRMEKLRLGIPTGDGIQMQKRKRNVRRTQLKQEQQKQQNELQKNPPKAGLQLGAYLASNADDQKKLHLELQAAESQEDMAVDKLKRWIMDPQFFVWDVFNADTDVWQTEALNALYHYDRVTVKSGHGVGKTTWLSWASLRHGMIHPPTWKCAVTAPTFTQLRDVFWATLQHWYRRMRGEYQRLFEMTSEVCRLAEAPENFIVRRAASKDRPDAFQGLHADHMLFICDEASGVPDIIFQVAMGAMSTKGAKTLLAGNPVRSQGYFFDSHLPRSAKRWIQFTVSSLDSRWVAEGYAPEIAEKYGINSNVYRVRVLGLFPEEEDDVVIPISYVEAAINRDPLDERLYDFIWGADIARYGNDRSTLCKRAGNWVPEPIKSWRGKDIQESAGRIRFEFENTPVQDRPVEIYIDAIGYGAGVVDILYNWGLPVRGVNVAETQSGVYKGQKKIYNRLRDELWFRCRDWFLTRSPVIPDDVDLVGELTMPHYGFTPGGEIKVQSKEDFRAEAKRSGSEFLSPDLAESLIMTFAAGLEFPITSETNVHKVGRSLWNRARQRRYRTYGGGWMSR